MEKRSVDIRLAGPDDESALAPLLKAFNRTEGIVWKPVSMITALRPLLRRNDLGLVLVARDRSACAIVGYGLATFGYDLEFGGRDAFITELFVDPANRGRGVGRALLTSMVEKLREGGVGAVHLMVRPENELARRLYEGCGFRVAPRIMMTRQIEVEEA
jgi:ribosomal protein S18 acetylase RimI-like enzyme